MSHPGLTEEDRSRRWRPTRLSERGSSPVGFVLVFPIVLFMVLLAIQFAVWEHSVHVASAAAQEGARVARGTEAAPGDGQARAQDFIGRLAPGILVNPQVQETGDADTARVEVSGSAPSIVPGLSLPVDAVSTGPRERFRPEGGP